MRARRTQSRAAETATQTLHRLTSIDRAFADSAERAWTAPVDDPRVVRDFEANDLNRFPWFYKRYRQSLPRLALPRHLPPTSRPAVAVLAGSAEIARSRLDLPQLSRLLHLSAGVVRTTTRPYATWLFRAAGSAGGRFPLEVYVAVPEGLGLPPGVHWYDPQDHALIQLGAPPQGDTPTVVVTGVPWRTGWRYRERGYRHVYWDAGTMLSQLLAVADSAGIAASLYSRFPDEEVAAVVGADGVHEWPVAVVALGDGRPAISAAGRAAAGEVDAAPMEFPLVTAAQRAGDRDALGQPWERGATVDVPLVGQLPIETAVLARGSQRRMDPTRGLSENMLRTSLPVAVRGVNLPHRFVVHNVESFAPGLYRWPDLSRPMRSGEMRDELYHVCWDQGLARDASWVVIAAADVGALDDREYRDVHLAAGLVMGRLHLLAYSLGASASGMTFVDSDVPSLLNERLDGLLFTCIGVPEYTSSTGGMPGAPTAVRMIQPRS